MEMPVTGTALIKRCPRCGSQRPLSEVLCLNTVDGATCNWTLATVVPTPSDDQAAATDASASNSGTVGSRCPNGHEVSAGDLLCQVCGALLDESPADADAHAGDSIAAPGEPLAQTVVNGWAVVAQAPTHSAALCRYSVRHEDGREGILTLYTGEGSEPDPDVYHELQRLSLDHVPAIYDIGHHENRPYEVSESVPGGSLDDLQIDASDHETIRSVALEIAKALRDFNRIGLRHRDLQPQAILVRTPTPLDLVVDGFGSAQLSEHDLETVAPLEQTRYMAPEAVAGAVSPASDWWSLGVMLLEKATQGECFTGVSDQAFLINALAHGVSIPDTVDVDIALLLRGLLVRDHQTRWRWSEFEQWFEGNPPEPPREQHALEPEAGQAIELGGVAHRRPTAYALAAAKAENWDEAVQQLLRGEIATWLEAIDARQQVRHRMRRIGNRDLTDNARLAVGLRYLNASIPLVYRGEIVSPAWLTRKDNIKAGHALLWGDAPDLLEDIDETSWLAQMKARALAVRQRAQHHDIELDEDALEVLELSSNRTNLASQWTLKRRQYPDTEYPALGAIMDRRQLTEEDLILLLSASVHQLMSAAEVIEQAVVLATNAAVETFDKEEALEVLQGHSTIELMRGIDDRTVDFARCDNSSVDDWVDQFRLQGRMSLPRALVTLSIPQARWQIPRSQAYVQKVVSFFENKLTYSIKRGPLARMTVSPNGAKVDLTELGSPRVSAKALLSAILAKSEHAQKLDPQIFIDAPNLERRLHKLHNHALLYQRDTGIDGLYLGFPFLVFSPGGSTVLPRIAPILLWPIKLVLQPGRRDTMSVAFDSDRDEVRLNPALESFLGEKTVEGWDKRRKTLMAGTVDLSGVLAEFARDFETSSEALARLPPADTKMQRGSGAVACSAVLFHVTYMGQAIVEDLKALRSRQPNSTSLAALLKLDELAPLGVGTSTVPELERFLTVDSDPTQEAAIMAARSGPGLVIEGPPGTGKSQTIVNLIADAIGRKQSVAVVCQKQAALDVVGKRLVAEGLGGRLVLVTDENRDRQRVLTAIREQLAGLDDAQATSRLESARRVTAERIEALEREFAAHHEALHTLDTQAGASYRELIGELVQLEASDSAPIQNYALRKVIQGFSRESLATVEEDVAPVIGDWLPAGYEDSPLSHLKPFHWGPGELQAFSQAFSDLMEAEQARVADRQTNTPDFETGQPDALKQWHNAHEARFRSLDMPLRADLGRWTALLWANAQRSGEGAEIIQALERHLQHLAKAKRSDHKDDWHEIVCTQTDKESRGWVKAARLASKEVGFLGRLNPLRWWARRRVRNLIGRDGQVVDRALTRRFLSAVELELHIKDTRMALCQFAETLALDDAQTAFQGADVNRLTRASSDLLVRLRTASEHFALLLECPAREQAIEAAIDPAAWARFVDSCEILEVRAGFERRSTQRLSELSPWLSQAWLVDLRARIDSGNDTSGATSAIWRCMQKVGPYQKFRARSQHLSEDAWNVLRALRQSEDALNALAPEDVADTFRRVLGREARLAWKARIESECPVLLMSRNDADSRTSTLRELVRQMRDLNRQLLSRNIDRRLIGGNKQWEGITRLRGPRAIRLREFMRQGADMGLMELRPVWLINPDIASRLFPLQAGMFDIIVYDEASQMPIEYALPTLYRGKAVVISGDEKQLPPTAFFHSRVESDEGEIFEGTLPDEDFSEEELDELEQEWNRREIKDCPDLLALGRSSLTSTMLQVHYRSQFRELIEFSNGAFYRGELNIPARHPDYEIRRVRPIEIDEVGGTYVDQTNPDEAEHVVGVLAGYWAASAEQRPSIGVVSFNRKQADLIEEALETRAVSDEPFRSAYEQELARVEDSEDMSFFVKNVENVQGDERDIIIFSTTFGRNGAGAFRRNFGVLGQKGGERRLNVAVTRARRKIIIASSMPVADISDMLSGRRRPAKARDFLQGYMHYATLVSKGELDEVRTLLGRLGSRETPVERSPGLIEDGFMLAVGDYIRALGFEPDRADDGTAFGLDYAIAHPEHGHYSIGIECDAPRHKILTSARAREIWRPQVLQRAIPCIHRVSSHRWYHEPEAERAALAAAITAVFGERTIGHA